MSDRQPVSFLSRAESALGQAELRRATAFTADRLRKGRLAAAEELGDWEEWRRRGESIRKHTLAHLDVYLERFVAECERRGGHVHLARTAEDVVQIVLTLLARADARRVAKAKSMLSEEVHLGERLLQEGYEVVETDLGEYIVQQAREHPSHIIVPAIHKSRGDIARLLSSVAGRELPAKTEELASFVRGHLRQVFLSADAGITGCNFAVAETGSLTLFTNEGNGRMVTTLPRLQITLVGIERLVPTWQDFEVLATLLARSATGQRLTAYVSVTAGPRRRPEDDGPEELHVILVDNGRSALLRDPELRSVLHCIRCGACLNVCPVYRHVGGHAYGSVYPGPIGAVLSPLLFPHDAEVRDLPWASSLCGACYEACPVRIPLHDLLVRLRHDQVAQGKARRSERLAFGAWAAAFRRPRRLHLATRTARLLQRRLGQWFSSLPVLKAWALERELPTIPAETFLEGANRKTSRGGGDHRG